MEMCRFLVEAHVRGGRPVAEPQDTGHAHRSADGAGQVQPAPWTRIEHSVREFSRCGVAHTYAQTPRHRAPCAIAHFRHRPLEISFQYFVEMWLQDAYSRDAGHAIGPVVGLEGNRDGGDERRRGQRCDARKATAIGRFPARNSGSGCRFSRTARMRGVDCATGSRVPPARGCASCDTETRVVRRARFKRRTLEVGGD